MNDTYLHITLTHLPIVGSLIALVILFSGWLQKNSSLQKAALWLLIFLAAITFVVNHTGEEAEEFLENMRGYSHDAIHEHEEAAEFAFWAMEIVGVGAMAALYMMRKGLEKARVLVLAVLVGTFVTCIIMARVGKLGGEIRHTEINPNQKPAETE